MLNVFREPYDPTRSEALALVCGLQGAWAFVILAALVDPQFDGVGAALLLPAVACMMWMQSGIYRIAHRTRNVGFFRFYFGFRREMQDFTKMFPPYQRRAIRVLGWNERLALCSMALLFTGAMAVIFFVIPPASESNS